MNKVKTLAKAGEAAGAAVGTGVKMARTRKRAGRAGRQLAERARYRDAVERGAHQASSSVQTALEDWWEDTQQRLTAQAAEAQERLADRVLEARRELAARIDPKPARRRRWPLLVVGLVALGGAVAVAVLSRRPQPVYEPDPPVVGVGRDSQSDQTLAASPDSNGVVSADRPSTRHE